MDSKTFREVVNKTREIIKRFEKIENKPWGVDGTMIELSKQVGDLSALIMMQEGYYPANRDQDHPRYQTSKEKIGDELADILMMLIRLADIYQIDLEAAHFEALQDSDKYLRSKGA